jgi:prephenate dehydrogenase
LHPSQPFKKIGIIGLGMMGGSICKGIKLKDPAIEVATASFPSEDLEAARRSGWIDREYGTAQELAASSELLILAAPQSCVIPLAEEISLCPSRSEPLLVMDIASVKGKIVTEFERLTSRGIDYVGTHPMAGKETKGFVHSQGILFVNRPWALVPHRQNRSESLEKIEAFIRFLGAEPLRLDPAAHDSQAALISHLPALLSKLYLDFVLSADAESMKIAGPGFQSFTRLGRAEDASRNELLNDNQELIEQYLDQWVDRLLKTLGRAA